MKISIITVVWNAADDIVQTINSVSQQDYPNIEYVIVDGVSTDGTLEEIHKRKGSVDHLISEPDTGLYDAMNKGKSLATGDYALFMNAGDVFINEGVISSIFRDKEIEDNLYVGNTLLQHGGNTVRAVKYHHQSIFYPKVFYQSQNYDIDNFKIVAESDYTIRAKKILNVVFIEKDIILSSLDGFGIHRFSTFKGTRSIFREMIKLYSKNGHKNIIFATIKSFLRCLVKYLAFKIGGLSLAAKVTLLRAKI